MLLFSLPLWFHRCFSLSFLLLLLAGLWVHGQGIVSPCGQTAHMDIQYGSIDPDHTSSPTK